MKTSFTWQVNTYECDKYYYSEKFFIPTDDEEIAFNMAVRFKSSARRFEIKVEKGFTGKARADVMVSVKTTNILHRKHVTDWKHEIVFPECEIPQSSIQTKTIGASSGHYHHSTHGSIYLYTMTIQCDITWYGFVNSRLQPHRNLEEYIMNSELSDFTIQVDETEFHVHKIILASQSPVFQKMFITEMKEKAENRIIILDSKVNVITEFLIYLYTGSTGALADFDVTIQLLALAEKYEILDLKYLCSGALIEHLNLNNVLEILDAAYTYNVDNLRKSTLKFMVENQSQVMFLPGFEEFMSAKPKYMFGFLVTLIANNSTEIIKSLDHESREPGHLNETKIQSMLERVHFSGRYNDDSDDYQCYDY